MTSSHEIDIQDVEYIRHGDRPLLARLYKPKSAGPFPIVVDLHGGAWTQSVATLAWLTFFAVSGHAFTWSRAAWPAVLGSALLVAGMATLIARASARGDISIVGPVYALSPIFTVLPDAVLSGTLPTPLGWLGLALALAGTSTLSGGGSLRALFARRDALDALGAAVLLGFLAAVDRWGADRKSTRLNSSH